MNPRTAQKATIWTIIAVAVVLFILEILAHLAHADYAVPGAGFFTYFALATWRVFGAVAFVVFLIIILILFLNPARLIRLQELSPGQLGPQLHVRCRHCSVVHWVQDTGQRPLYHFCPECGVEGQYGDSEHGQKDFIYTQVEVKLGCRACGTSFLVPDPLVRPLHSECPNCGAAGVLKEDERPKEAEETELQCYSCGHVFHIYAIHGRWSGRFKCPHCQTENQVPGVEAPSSGLGEASGGAPA